MLAGAYFAAGYRPLFPMPRRADGAQYEGARPTRRQSSSRHSRALANILAARRADAVGAWLLHSAALGGMPRELRVSRYHVPGAVNAILYKR